VVELADGAPGVSIDAGTRVPTDAETGACGAGDDGEAIAVPAPSPVIGDTATGATGGPAAGAAASPTPGSRIVAPPVDAPPAVDSFDAVGDAAAPAALASVGSVLAGGALAPASVI
jgi:hypothetical protein